MKSDAIISQDQIYRYWLRREFDENNKNILLFVMYNPSKATAEISDPTINRCIGYAKREGCGTLEVVNLFAFRETNPKLLPEKLEDALGPENLKHISLAAKNAYKVVLGYGNFKINPNVIKNTLTEIKKYHEKVWCLGKNKNSTPKHPLYLKLDAPLIEF